MDKEDWIDRHDEEIEILFLVCSVVGMWGFLIPTGIVGMIFAALVTIPLVRLEHRYFKEKRALRKAQAAKSAAS